VGRVGNGLIYFFIIVSSSLGSTSQTIIYQWEWFSTKCWKLFYHCASNSINLRSISIYHYFRMLSMPLSKRMIFTYTRDCHPVSNPSYYFSSRSTIGKTLSCNSRTRFIMSYFLRCYYRLRIYSSLRDEASLEELEAYPLLFALSPTIYSLCWEGICLLGGFYSYWETGYMGTFCLQFGAMEAILRYCVTYLVCF